jgi:hypothetical protein
MNHRQLGSTFEVQRKIASLYSWGGIGS